MMTPNDTTPTDPAPTDTTNRAETNADDRFASESTDAARRSARTRGRTAASTAVPMAAGRSGPRPDTTTFTCGARERPADTRTG